MSSPPPATSVADDGSEDVNDFLFRIRQLGNKRDKEDEERARKLEQDIIQGRKERQARRTERARSISPEKSLSDRTSLNLSSLSSIPSSSTSTPTTTFSASRITPPVDLFPTHQDSELHQQGFSADTENKVDSVMADTGPMDSTTSKEDAAPTKVNSGGGGSSAATVSFASWRQARIAPGELVDSPEVEKKDKENEKFPPSATSMENPDYKSVLPDSVTKQGEDNKDYEEVKDAMTPKDRPAASVTSFSAFRKAREDQLGVTRQPATKPMEDVPSLTPTPLSKRPGFASSASSPQQVHFTDPSTSAPDDKDDHLPPSHSRMNSAASTTSFSTHNRSGSRFSIHSPALGSPSPLGHARMNSRASTHADNADSSIAMSPTQNRLAGNSVIRPGSPQRASPSDRPSSPTKGLGGFVQSAMLRRSDSVSKRWSAMNLNSPGSLVGSHLPRRESVSHSRPGSSNGIAAAASGAAATSSSAADDETTAPSRSATFSGPRPKSLVMERSDSVSSAQSGLGSDGAPSSPNKRWSPTKASWLESALNRPESPNKKSNPPTFGQEPEWKSQLARLKASRQAVQKVAQESAKKEDGGARDGSLQTGILPSLKKPDLSTRKDKSFAARMGVNAADLQQSVKEDETIASKKDATTAEEKEKSGSLARSETSTGFRRSPEKKDMNLPGVTTSTAFNSESGDTGKEQEKEEERDKTKPGQAPVKPTISTSVNSVLSHINSLNSPDGNSRTPSPIKSRESTSQFDFRSNLRRREGGNNDLERRPSNAAASPATKSPIESQTPEFQNVFAKLKRTNTATGQGSPTVAKSPSAVKPLSAFKDEFKENITRGKNALNQTGGPKKTERVDEFKESLIKQKEAFKIKDETGHPVGLRGRTGSIMEKKADIIPEALERRRALKSSVDLRSSAREKGNELPIPLPEKPKPLDFARTPCQKSTSENQEDKGTAADKKMTSPETLAATSVPLSKTTSPSDTNSQQSSSPSASSIASRLNPGLANLLSRGPPSLNSKTESSLRATPVSATSAASSGRLIGHGSRNSSNDEPGQGPALTHITKGRAKGPKRRAPQAAAATMTAAASGTSSATQRVSRKSPVQFERKISNDRLTEKKSDESLRSKISRLRSGIAASHNAGTMKTVASTGAELESSKVAAPPVARKSDDVRRISAQLSSGRSGAEASNSNSDGEKTPPPGQLQKKPSLERKMKQNSPKGSSTGIKLSPKPSPTLQNKPSIENKSLFLTKKSSFERRPSPTSPFEGRKPSPSPSPKPDLRGPGPMSPSISDRLNQLQGSPTPFKSLRKSPTCGGRPEFEAKPRVPPKNDDIDKLKKSPPPLRSPSSSIQLSSNTVDKFPTLQQSRTWGAKVQRPLSSSPAEASGLSELPLRKQRSDAGPIPVEKDGQTKREPKPSVPRKSSSAGTFDQPMKNPVNAPIPFCPSPSLTSSSSRASSFSMSIPTPTSASFRNTLARVLPFIPTQTAQHDSSPVSETSGPSDTASITSTDTDPKKQARRRPTPLKLKSLPSIPVQPVVQSKALPSPQHSPFPERQVANTLFTSFFDAPPSAIDSIPVDPVPFFERPGDEPRVKTQSTRLWELQGYGKKRSLPVNQEHILFEESMYLLVHIFEDQNGAKVCQTLLWVGDDVNESAFEDAQSFARKIAKEHNTKLDIIYQGKETAPFIQALGGIIIIRRGSSSRVRSSSSYMLCGRRHLGQIVFDEVELSAKSLCSGYPYIVSATTGKVYLWEGHGSGADELGCAKLIAMDMVLTGEINQVMEGEETSEFWGLFSDSDEVQGETKPSYWKAKSTNEKYTTRLFRVDHDRRRRSGFWGRRAEQSPISQANAIIHEIKCYGQRDLDAAHIHIVDAFFQLYVIVGERASGRYAEFATALLFAQEYAITAVSMEDRPFLPQISVVLYGFPDEAKTAFRKWTDRSALTGRKMPDIINLRAAIEAIR
ncbi:hypothetical protein KEM54_003144 [Ascosphaera aggregata]|nr:hypothetical protein KEM54_003144 [Ascosphaera aggregata]